MEIRFLVEQRNRISSVAAFDIPYAKLYANNSSLITGLQLAETSLVGLNEAIIKQIPLSEKFYDSIELSLHTTADLASVGLEATLEFYNNESDCESNSVLTELGIDINSCLSQNLSSFIDELKTIRTDGYKI